MFKVQTGVPVPAPRKTAAPRRKYPLDQMDVGGFFFVPDKKTNNISTHISTAGRKLGRKFITRLLWMVEEDGEWLEAEPTTVGAVQGVGVWRNE